MTKIIERIEGISVTSSSLSYGQNSWLINEIYESYKKNRDQVDKSWVEFFDSHHDDFPLDFSSSQPQSGKNATGPNGQKSTPPKDGAQRNGKQSSAEHNGTTTDNGKGADTDHPAITSASRAGNDKPTISSNSVISGAVTSKSSRPGQKSLTDEPVITTQPKQTESRALSQQAADYAHNLQTSLHIPSAYSSRPIPAKVLHENKLIINQYLARTRGGKITFTHIIGYAIVQAIKVFSHLNNHFELVDGIPNAISPSNINLGLTVTVNGKDGSTNVVVPVIRNAETMSFHQFVTAVDSIVRNARKGTLHEEDLRDGTITIADHGIEGLAQATPRILPGEGALFSIGATRYPVEYEGASEDTVAALAVGKIVNLGLVYDQRVIQGAETGIALTFVHDLLISDAFFNEIFESLSVPHAPVRWRQDITTSNIDKNTRVLEIIEAYRNRGHLIAQTDPLEISNSSYNIPSDVDESKFDLTLWDLDRTFNVGGFQGHATMKLRDLLSSLRDSYSRHIGTEYTHILETDQRLWLQERLEAPHLKPSQAEQKYILNRLNAAEAFETFLQTKYVGQKRFSLEGAESVIPMMDAVLDQSAHHNLEEVVIGMPHRGRLNVLANVVGKPYSKIFTEFEGNLDPRYAHGSGDVKYHLGADGKYYQMFGDNEIKVSLTANPSHLEAVDPVLEGIVRAKTDLNNTPGSVLPLMLHGDAAFAGQGIVAETLQMMNLPGYSTGGTIHIVVNNQIGFTTAPKDSRSSEYCTDVAKMVGAPIFHVNGDDPEACVWVARIAVDFRERFHKDIVIDMVCYRRRGHNEGDDPSMTQPMLYDVIDTKKSVRRSYTDNLIGRGDISLKEAEDALRDYQGQLERVFNEVRELEKYSPKPSPSVEGDQVLPVKLKTATTRETIEMIGDAFINVPEGFTPHPRVSPVMKKRHEMSRKGEIDWAFGELLAFGSLVRDGKRVRLSGEDCRRGTFSQRHSVLIDRKNGDEYHPLRNLTPSDPKKEPGFFEVYDSLLSEYAVVGFEYGYTVANPNALVLWEGQFGDFAVAAQSIIDEFISSGEAKWGQLSNVVMLLPHGQEGQGPDHSSGRIERYLQLCAEASMTVAQPSTPASYFHLLRRHAIDGVTRPLIVFTPKSMLRMKAAVSNIEDFTDGKFRSVLEEPSFLAKEADRSKVKRVLLVSGKLYYELKTHKTNLEKTENTSGNDSLQADEVAIVRLEQFYPVPYRRLAATIRLYPNATEVYWVQEEPANQGAWPFLALNLPGLVDEEHIQNIKRISRRAMSAPASGSSKIHAVEQQEIINQAFTATPNNNK